jgi:hypothetical protein
MVVKILKLILTRINYFVLEIKNESSFLTIEYFATNLSAVKRFLSPKVTKFKKRAYL